MYKLYRKIICQYQKITLSQERRLISKAQKGSKKCKDEIVFRHISFLIFRISKILFPSLIHSFGKDLLQEAILIVYAKIDTYDLNYRNKKGKRKAVRFSSYIWKRIDGFIIDSLHKETSKRGQTNLF